MTVRRIISLPFISRVLGLLLSGLLTGCAATYRDLDETYIKESFVQQRWLSFLHDGETNAEEVMDSLGTPTAEFENGSILGYRLVLAAEKQDSTVDGYRDHFGRNYLWAGNNPTAAFNEGIGDHNEIRKRSSETGKLWVWRDGESEQTFFLLFTREAEYSLILEFDGNRILKNHSLIRVKP